MRLTMTRHCIKFMYYFYDQKHCYCIVVIIGGWTLPFCLAAQYHLPSCIWGVPIYEASSDQAEARIMISQTHLQLEYRH
jgi:hypothetical protein